MNKKLLTSILVVLFAFIILSGIACTKPETPGGGGEPQPEPDTAIFNFEGGTQGWQKASGDDGIAVIEVSQDTSKAYKGTGSLKVDVKMIKGEQEKAGVEVYFADPVDMTGKTLTINIFIDPAIKGTNNGIQIFAKDSDWSYGAGPWISVNDNDVGVWKQISLNFDNPQWGWSGGGDDEVLDITKIKAIGVKIQMGGQTPSGETLEGSYWIDSVNY